jgi:hypothetical protein
MHMKATSRIPALFAYCAVSALSSTALLAQESVPAEAGHDGEHSSKDTLSNSPLIQKVRNATARFRDINVAIKEGWVQGTPCVSGPNFGAMGVHFLLPSRVGDGVLNADQPESLLYEPQSDGSFRLLGVEFIVLAEDWDAQHPDGAPPAVEGHLANFVGEPNRYRLPAFYELHVWAWERNPVGSFADWNTRVTCAKLPLD